MTAYWITFTDGSRGCVEVGPEDPSPIELAEFVKAKRVRACLELPYPASPRINQRTSGKYGPIPSLCYTPDKCQGRLGCPKNPCCTE